MSLRGAEKWTLGLGALLAVSASAAVCRADDSAAAQALFDQGKRAMAAQDYAQACPKLEESLRLEYGLGTLLNLADCYEHQGKLATAWSKFLELASKARAAGQADRARIGRERAAALAPKLSNLEIDVPAANRVDGLSIQRDGTVVGPAGWGSAIPADSGSHRVTASAPGREPWSDTVTVSDGATTARVTIPLLKPLPAPPVARHAAPESTSRSSGTLLTSQTETEAPKSNAGLGTPRILAIASAAVGAAGIGVGTYFGLVSLARRNDASAMSSKAGCEKNLCSGPLAPVVVADGNDAISAGNISTIGFIVGGVGLAGAVTLWLVGVKSEHPSATSAELGVGPGSIQLRGTW